MPQVIFPGLFPFCVVETENSKLVGNKTYYPVGFSKEDACFLFWKAKKLHIKADYTWKAHLANDFIYHFNRDQDLITTNSTTENGIHYNEYGIPFLPKTETDFICFNKKNSIWWNNASNVSLTFFATSCYYNIPFCYKFNNLYYLNLALNFDLVGYYVNHTVTSYDQGGGYGFTQVGSIQFIINNKTYDINMYSVDIVKIPNFGVQLVTPLTGSITVSEVWDYSQ